jgi:hypothetical protein
MRSKDNSLAEVLSKYEEIPLTFHLEQLLALSAFPQAQLEYFTPVRGVFSCPQCEAAIARVRIGSEYRTVDAILDDSSEPFARKWNANVLHEHECGHSQ